MRVFYCLLIFLLTFFENLAISKARINEIRYNRGKAKGMTNSMKINSSVLVHLGFGKYVRSDRVTALIPVEEERGPGRRTFVYLEGQRDPIVAARAEDTIARDLVQEPREVTQSRQQQEILSDLY